MPSPSHRYDFTLRQLLPVVGLIVLPLALFSTVMHLGAALHLLPAPCPALDTDRTILLHQAHASRTRHSAGLVLIGDSSCLMDVSADLLTQLQPGAPATLNLGTLSYLDLHAFGSLLAQYQSANPKRLQTVVLLMHPEALRRPSPDDYDLSVLQHFYAGLDYCGPTLSSGLCFLGVEIFRGRILSRAVPQPLPGGFGRAYGFTHDLWRYLSAHGGSALDPGRFDLAAAQGNPEYRLAPSLQGASSAFRSTLAPGVRLLVGITPVPQSFAPKQYDARQRRLLETWSQWLQADVPLSELPATWPDELFASTTHLNERGVRLYTEQLSQAITAHAPVRGAPTLRPGE
jgi:hypothetical protein